MNFNTTNGLINLGNFRLQTPVALFSFNRPELTETALRQISRIRPPRVYLVADGATGSAISNERSVKVVHQQLEEFDFPGDVRLMISSQNLGLRERFFSALDEIFELESHLVIIEDDCAVDDSFYAFAQLGLEEFGDSEKFGLVTAHNPIQYNLLNKRAWFSTYPRIWGWATTSAVWREFRGAKALRTFPLSEKKLAVRAIGSATMRFLFSRMLTDDFAAKTWDVDFASFIIQRRLLSLTPPRNLVNNVGITGVTTNTHSWSASELPAASRLKFVALPSKIRPPSGVDVFEDTVRILRWAVAFARRPLPAIRKLLSLSSRNKV